MIITITQITKTASDILVSQVRATIGDIRVIIILFLSLNLFRYFCIILIFFIKSSDFSFPPVSQSSVKRAKMIFS